LDRATPRAVDRGEWFALSLFRIIFFEICLQLENVQCI
jgi:hypothetical protein